MRIAAETTKAHLSTFIFLSHAQQKAERCSVGRYLPQVDRERADDYVRGVGDQIEMVQYIRGRIGEDRDTVLDMGRVPDYHTRRWIPSALSKGKGKGQSEHTARMCVMEPASKRARMTDAQAQRSPSTVTNESGFTPLTPDADNGDYSPVSDAGQKNRTGSRAAANAHPAGTPSQKSRRSRQKPRQRICS
jgi:hypothetical protein